mmetsp:Transcript_9010/g.19927  ORF Transcript_9010/g.19927 Transcript_9010/m.19927 type:complete len:210 (-) Transcript_9010:152-781(-)
MQGCMETKLLLLHIKTCQVRPGHSCSRNGCNSARKLLAHYRKCRESRVRSPSNRPHRCLICSFVARKVKYELDKTPIVCKAINASNADSTISGGRLFAKIKNAIDMPPPVPRSKSHFIESRRRSKSADSTSAGVNSSPFCLHRANAPLTPKMSNCRDRSKSVGDSSLAPRIRSYDEFYGYREATELEPRAGTGKPCSILRSSSIETLTA